MREFAAHHIPAGVIKMWLTLLLFRYIEARLETTDSSVRRKWGAAIGDTRRTGSAPYQVHPTVVATCADEGALLALAATGRRPSTRLAANAGKPAS